MLKPSLPPWWSEPPSWIYNSILEFVTTRTWKNHPQNLLIIGKSFFFRYCQPAQNRPKSHFLFHENVSLCAFYIMTLDRTVKNDPKIGHHLSQCWKLHNWPCFIKYTHYLPTVIWQESVIILTWSQVYFYREAKKASLSAINKLEKLKRELLCIFF